jgi:hypothetical protein
MLGEESFSETSDIAVGTRTEAAKEGMKSSKHWDTVTSDIMGLPKKIHCKLGAWYMTTYNVDTLNELTNGVSGWLMKIDVGGS